MDMRFRPGKQADKGQGRRTLARLVGRCAWLYAAVVLGLCILLHAGADRWWPATLVMFGPRWVWALPLGILFPAVVIVHPRLVWLPLISLVLIVGPLMDFCVPWQTFVSQEHKFAGVRI